VVLRGTARPAARGDAFAPVARRSCPPSCGYPTGSWSPPWDRSARVARLLPEIAPLERLNLLPPRTSVASPVRAQGRLIEAIASLLGRIAELRPVLALEDIDAADPATRALSGSSRASSMTGVSPLSRPTSRIA
jgi:hypothetical protein